MRRSCLLGTMMTAVLLLLGGCSGLGKFFSDTITLPGMNPNLPYGLSENTDRARGQLPAEAPILPESGNIWPGPPKPLPTLSDVSRLQGNGLSGDLKGGDLKGGDLKGGEAMRDGGSMSMGEHDSIAHGVTGADSFSGGGLNGPAPDAASRRRVKPQAGPGGSITIPNGDGTSTVIEPDGTVKTVKTPAK